MIKSLELKHFQSHKLTHLDFHSGVNSIIGASNSGKTAVLRAIYWLARNRPSGQAFIAFDNRDKNGDAKNVTSLALQVDDAKLVRFRQKGTNGYELWTRESMDSGAPALTFEAVGTDVPEEIARALNFSGVNIQRQMDAPFLFSDNPADVARFFNAIIRLDLIDRVLSTAEGNRIRNNQEQKALSSEIKVTEQKIKDYEWLDAADRLITKAENVETRLNQRRNDVNKLSSELSSHSDMIQTVAGAGRAAGAETIVTAALALSADLEKNKKTSSGLHDSLLDYDESRSEIRTVKVAIRAEDMVGRADTLRQSIENKKNGVRSLRESIDDYEKIWLTVPTTIPGPTVLALMLNAQNVSDQITEVDELINKMKVTLRDWDALDTNIKRETEEIERIEAQMPDVCPLCDGTGRLKKERV
jgi:chromosome segregation ATPase